MSDITFAQDAWDEYLYWQLQDKKTLRKINSQLQEVMRDPFHGTGKPEPLRNHPEAAWSRRINDKDRLVYIIRNDRIVVLQCKGHYDDQ